MKFLIVLSMVAVACVAQDARAKDQVPPVWDALQILRGGKDITTEEQQDILANAVPGKDYPINAVIPDYNVDCSKYNQAGFYAETAEPSKCQIFHRCDVNGLLTSYLCPNRTLFNQITLICDWFFNVDCSKSAQFRDYSNSRLYKENVPLLDDQLQLVTGAIQYRPQGGQSQAPAPAPAPAPYRPRPQPPKPARPYRIEVSGEASSASEGAQ